MARISAASVVIRKIPLDIGARTQDKGHSVNIGVPMVRSIEEILSDGGDAMRRLLREAFEAGVERGKADTRSALADFLSGQVAAPAQIAPHGRLPDEDIAAARRIESQARATPGTVKPGILRFINGSIEGFTTEEIIEATGFKSNSVRGTLSTLQSEGAITRDGNLWVSAEKILKGGHADPKENPGAEDAGAV